MKEQPKSREEVDIRLSVIDSLFRWVDENKRETIPRTAFTDISKMVYAKFIEGKEVGVSVEPPKPEQNIYENAAMWKIFLSSATAADELIQGYNKLFTNQPRHLQGLIENYQRLKIGEKLSGEAKTPKTVDELEKLFEIKFCANMYINFDNFKHAYPTLWIKVILPTLKQIANVE